MQLYSISFLFYFLPLFLGVYYITPEKEKALVTIIGSILFFLLQEELRAWQLVIALALTGLTFLVGTELRKPKRGALLTLTITGMAAVLVFFKCYAGGIFLPPGMSFYLFQMAAYLFDVRRKRLEPEKNLILYSTQILMFPKLLSGPLVEPRQLQAQANRPKLNQIRFRSGLQELVFGLSMKVLLADRLGGLWSQAAVVGYESISAAYAWLALVAFALRLYLDFQGYSLMAVGLGKMMGFELPRNFDDPYAARSVSDFFRRWHMTLAAWFRDYVYIPLGGNRKGAGRTIVNILLVWVLTGLWHGIGGNYLVWALFLAVLIINEKLWLGKVLHRIPLIAHFYTVIAILISWVPFAIGDWHQMLGFLEQLAGIRRGGVSIREISSYLPLLAVAILFATPIPGRLFDEYRERLWFDCILFVLFWVSIYFVATAPQDPFLYFKF